MKEKENEVGVGLLFGAVGTVLTCFEKPQLSLYFSPILPI